MADFPSIPAFNAHLDKFLGDMSKDMLTAFGKDVGKRAVAIANEEAAKDLGSDRKFSHWAPVADTRAVQIRPGVVSIRPTPRGAGAWTVVTVGRHQGNASGFSGPGVNSKTGMTARTKSGAVRKTRARKAKRWNGTTEGHGTADRAVSRMDRVVSEVAQANLVKTVVRYFE